MCYRTKKIYIYCLQARQCVYQYGHFTGWGSEGVKDLWPALVLVHGKPRHPRSWGSVERTNGDIKDVSRVFYATGSAQ